MRDVMYFGRAERRTGRVDAAATTWIRAVAAASMRPPTCRYESSSSLTDLKLLRGKKKKGVDLFASGFWTKVFKPPPRPAGPAEGDE